MRSPRESLGEVPVGDRESFSWEREPVSDGSYGKSVGVPVGSQ